MPEAIRSLVIQTTCDTENMHTFIDRLLSASRKTVLRKKPLFEPYQAVKEPDLAAIECRVEAALPKSLKNWLLRAGFGDLNDELSFRAEWFSVIDRGQLKGHVTFAQDQGGNFYAFCPLSGAIHFIDRSMPKYARIADDFALFMEEFESHGFELQKWTDCLEPFLYDWAAPTDASSSYTPCA